MNEYELHDNADDYEDDKRIRSAENRAIRTRRRPRNHPYQFRQAPSAAAGSFAQLSTSAPVLPVQGFNQNQPFRAYRRRLQPTDLCCRCFQPGHWKSRCPLNFDSRSKRAMPQAQRRTDHYDKYFEIFRYSCVWYNVRLKNHISILRKKENECFDRFGNDSIKESLFKHLHYWKHIETYDSILSVIENSYSIPFSSFPPSMNLRNNMSALNNRQFVSESVSELLISGRIVQVDFQPYVVNCGRK